MSAVPSELPEAHPSGTDEVDASEPEDAAAHGADESGQREERDAADR